MQKQTDKWDIFTADDLHISSNRVINNQPIHALS